MNVTRSWCILCFLGCLTCFVNGFNLPSGQFPTSSVPSSRTTRVLLQQQHVMPSIHPDNEQIDVSVVNSSSKTNPSFAWPSSQRRWFIISAAMGVLWSTSAGADAPVDDPLVLFGERLSETKAMPKSSGGKWPQDAAHPLPLRMDDDDDIDTSRSALEEALDASQLKKQINPTTHG